MNFSRLHLAQVHKDVRHARLSRFPMKAVSCYSDGKGYFLVQRRNDPSVLWDGLAANGWDARVKFWESQMAQSR